MLLYLFEMLIIKPGFVRKAYQKGPKNERCLLLQTPDLKLFRSMSKKNMMQAKKAVDIGINMTSVNAER